MSGGDVSNFSLHFATRLAISPFHFLEIKSSATTIPFTFYDGSAILGSIWERDHFIDSLMVPLAMKVLHELADCPAIRSFPEKHKLIQTLPIAQWATTKSESLMVFGLLKTQNPGENNLSINAN